MFPSQNDTRVSWKLTRRLYSTRKSLLYTETLITQAFTETDPRPVTTLPAQGVPQPPDQIIVQKNLRQTAQDQETSLSHAPRLPSGNPTNLSLTLLVCVFAQHIYIYTHIKMHITRMLPPGRSDEH